MYSNLFTIGNSPELKTIQSGKAVLSLSLACDVGWGDNKRTSWLSAALWEKRAEALAPYLVKGQQVYCVLDDVEIDEYNKQDGTTGAKMKARIVDIKLVRGGEKASAPKPAKKPEAGGMDDYDSDSIPF